MAFQSPSHSLSPSLPPLCPAVLESFSFAPHPMSSTAIFFQPGISLTPDNLDFSNEFSPSCVGVSSRKWALSPSGSSLSPHGAPRGLPARATDAGEGPQHGQEKSTGFLKNKKTLPLNKEKTMRTQRTGERRAEGLRSKDAVLGSPGEWVWGQWFIIPSRCLDSRLEGHTSALGETSNKVTVRGRRTT